jgi:sugar lactone lactonase YvrE
MAASVAASARLGTTSVGTGDAVIAPEAFALDSDGRVYFSDCPAQRIFRLESDGRVEVVAGSGPQGFDHGGFAGDGGPATEATLDCPGGLAFDGRGDLFVADTLNNRIRMIDRRGIISTVVGSGPTGMDSGGYAGDGGPATKARLEFPNGVAFDPSGDLYIADHGNDAIRRVGPGNVITTFAGTGVGGFSGDGGLASRAQLHGPWSIVFDARGNLYFTDKENDRIRMIDRRGVITTIGGKGHGKSRRGSGSALRASFVDPYGLASDGNGDLYVSDDEANVVRVIDGRGTISSVAGTGKTGFAGDGGPAIDARLDTPFGLLVDPAGNLYVADGGNGCVRMIDDAGTIRSVVCS